MNSHVSASHAMNAATYLERLEAEGEAGAHVARETQLHLAEDEQVLGWLHPFDWELPSSRRSKERSRTAIITNRRFLLVDVRTSKEVRSVSVESVPVFHLRCVRTTSSVGVSGRVTNWFFLDFSRPAFASDDDRFRAPSVLSYAVDGPLADEARAFLAVVARLTRPVTWVSTIPPEKPVAA